MFYGMINQYYMQYFRFFVKICRRFYRLFINGVFETWTLLIIHPYPVVVFHDFVICG